MRKAVTVILLLFVGASVVYLVAGERLGGATENNASSSAVAPPAPSDDSAEQPRSGVPSDESRPEAARTPPAAGKLAASVETPKAGISDASEEEHKITVYYFHRTQRCRTCLTMEEYAKQALDGGLADAMASGELEWRAVNVEKPENEHFVKEYELYASALVIVDSKGGQVQRSKTLEQIWDLVGDESAFKRYVRDETEAYLGGAP